MEGAGEGQREPERDDGCREWTEGSGEGRRVLRRDGGCRRVTEGAGEGRSSGGSWVSKYLRPKSENER